EIGADLVQVLAAGEVAEGEVDGPLAGTRRRRGGEERTRGSLEHRLRVVSEDVAVELGAHLLNRLALEQRWGPQQLADDVVHQRPHVPIAAWRGRQRSPRHR